MGLRGGTTNATVEGENVILGGDVILAVQGIPFSMKNYERIQAVVSRLNSGDLVDVKILRGGEQLELKAVISP
jgi:serine protease Do